MFICGRYTFIFFHLNFPTKMSNHDCKPQSPFWKLHREFDIFNSLAIDSLHQLDIGVFGRHLMGTLSDNLTNKSRALLTPGCARFLASLRDPSVFPPTVLRLRV